MATKRIKLTGTVKWAQHIVNPEEFMGKTKWKLSLSMDAPSKQVFKDQKLTLRPREYDDGIYYTFSRETSKTFPNGEHVEFTPPQVTMDGQEFDKLIGNGSKVEIEVSVFATKSYGNGHRLEAVRVLDWVEYKAPDLNENPAVEAPEGKERPF